jgi:hypothetical protein
MSRFFLLLVLLGLWPGTARANLGETVAQIVARYGKPTGYAEASARSPFGNLFFRAGGYELLIFLLDDKEVGARVSRTDKQPLGDAERQSIMAADTDGSPWAPVASADPSVREWMRGDKATVMYDTAKNMLIFTSDAMAQALHAPPANAPSGPAPATGP